VAEGEVDYNPAPNDGDARDHAPMSMLTLTPAPPRRAAADVGAMPSAAALVVYAALMLCVAALA